MQKLYLAADIGGTKSDFALGGPKGGVIFSARYSSRGLRRVEKGITHFLRDYEKSGGVCDEIEAACLCIAGPVQGDNCNMTNLNLQVNTKQVKKACPYIKKVLLANDLEAIGNGVLGLSSQDVVCLTEISGQANWQKGGNMAVIAPGTGLGQCMILDGKVYPSEAAHADFAPKSDLEIELYRSLREQLGHVSWEQLLSGRGMERMYRFLAARDGRQTKQRTAPEISRAALEGEDALCQQVVQLFLKLLAAEAGNLGLTTLAYGGVWIAGKIMQKNLPLLQKEVFWENFCDKGSMRALVQTLPLYVVTQEQVALLGGLRLAREAVH